MTRVAPSSTGHMGAAFAVNLFSSLALIIPAVLLVIWEPAATGSGMPEVISYLNGAKIPHLFSWRTTLAKGLGLIVAVSSGLALGYVRRRASAGRSGTKRG